MPASQLTINSTNVRNLITLSSIRLGLGTLSRLAPRLALAWAERLFLTPPRYDWSPIEAAWRAQAETGLLHTNGLPIAEWNGKAMQTYRWGEARRGKVVLLHGWGGRATQFHALIAPLNAAGYQVVGIDAPGHGASAGRRASVLHFSNALSRLLRNEGEVTAVIAHSLGGASAIHALTSQRHLVGKLALIAPSADLVAYARQVGDMLGLDTALQQAMRRRMETRLGVDWDDLNAVRRAARLQLPGLVLHDRQDKEVSHHTGAAIAAAWPGAEIRLSDGLGHRRILRDEAVVAQLLDFVSA